MKETFDCFLRFFPGSICKQIETNKNFSFILNLQCSLYLPKLVCVLVYLSFGGKKKFPWWTQRQQEKIKNKTVLFLDEDYDDVGTHKKKKKKKEAS